jgi:predicted AAA+ superfamily ATPase
MLNPDLAAAIRADNPWLETPSRLQEVARARLPKTMVERTLASELRQVLKDHRHAHLVIGPRQAGKSTLVWSIVQHCDALLFLDCEERLIRNWCRSPSLFLADATTLLPGGGVLFLEEAQWLEEAGLFIKGLVDRRPDWSIFVTGSASFHLLARTRESLAGRATRHRLWPLSLAEVGRLDPGVPTGLLPSVRRDAVARLLIRGGYPEAWTSQEPESVLLRLVEAFVLRDASDRFRIERPDAFRILLELAARQVGDLVNLSEWAGILGIAGSTVSEYLSILEETHLIARIRPFVGGKRAELTSTPKLYFIDNGLRNQLVGGFGPLERRPDIGKLLENFVFSEIHKRWPWPGQVRYWRTRNGAEVDFVLEPQPGQFLGIEVKATTRGRPRLSRSARSFLAAYSPTEFLVVHRGAEHAEVIAGVPVRWVPVEMLPEALPPSESTL